MFKKFLSISLIAFFLPLCMMAQYSSHFSFANSKGAGRKSYHRYTFGVSAILSNATATTRYRTDISKDLHFFPPTDTTVSQKLRAKNSWSIHGETFFPVAQLTENSGLALAVGISINLFSYDVQAVTLGTGSKAVTTDGNASGMMYGLPIGIEYRSGGDYVLDKSKKTMFSFGIGGFPSWTELPYGPTNGTDVSAAKAKPFKVVPYVKAEFGFFAGIAFKVRAMSYLGKPTYVDKYIVSEIDDTRYDYSLKGDSYGVQLGLAILPFSWDWGNDGY